MLFHLSSETAIVSYVLLLHIAASSNPWLKQETHSVLNGVSDSPTFHSMERQIIEEEHDRNPRDIQAMHSVCA